MADCWVIEIDGLYVEDDGEGGVIFGPIEKAFFFESAEEAEETASMITKDGWRVVRLPDTA